MEVILPLWAAIALLIGMAAFFGLWGALLYIRKKRRSKQPPEQNP